MFDLNNREISAYFWLFVFLTWALSGRSVRNQAYSLLQMLLRPPLLWIILSFLVYVSLLVTGLYFLGFWQMFLLKDTLVWLLGSATALTFSANDVKSNAQAWKLFASVFKWTIFLEFITNFYTFQLWIELILVPVVTLLGMMQVFVKNKPEHKDSGKVINTLLMWIGLLVIAYVSYKTIAGFIELFTMENLKSLLVAPILTLLFIPFVYIMAVFLAYSDLMVTVELYWRNEPVVRTWKRAIKKHAGINLTRIYRIKRKINKQDLVRSKDVATYLKNLTRN